MSTDEGRQPASPVDSDEWRADARQLYQASVDLWSNEGNNQSSRLNAFLVSNSVFFGLIGLALVQPPPTAGADLIVDPRCVIGAASFAGLALSTLWYSVILRSVAYSRAYMAAGRLAERLLTAQADPHTTELPPECQPRKPTATTTGPFHAGGGSCDESFRTRLDLGLTLVRLGCEKGTYLAYWATAAIYAAVLVLVIFGPWWALASGVFISARAVVWVTYIWLRERRDRASGCTTSEPAS